MERKEYVCIFVERPSSHPEFEVPSDDFEVLFILKDRPASQAGKLNLIGGGIEAGETPAQAARRELKEETGYDLLMEPKIVGKIKDREFVIHVLVGVVDPDWHLGPKPREGETEVPMWLSWSEANSQPNLIPNLRAIVPLAKCGVTGWTITDNLLAAKDPHHSFSLEVETYLPIRRPAASM